jgi:hypothetical protein
MNTIFKFTITLLLISTGLFSQNVQNNKYKSIEKEAFADDTHH